jgi:hypothetical protein
VFARQVAPALADVAIDRPAERAALIGSQLLGIAVARYIIGIPPLVAMDDQTLARWLKPVLTHYLTDPAPEAYLGADRTIRPRATSSPVTATPHA